MSDEKNDWEVIEDEMKKAEERIENARRQLAHAEAALIGPRAELHAAQLVYDSLFYMRDAYAKGPDKATLLDPVPSPSPESSSQETVTDETPIIETQSEHRGEKIMWAPRLIPDDFIAWDGGLPPAELTAKVDVIDRQGWKWRGWLVGQMNWGHSGSNGDIVAYRLAKSPTDDERTSVVTDHDRVEPEPNFKEGEREDEDPTAVAIAEYIAAENAETPPPVSELDSQVTPQDVTEQSQENPAAQMFGKALAAESEAKEQRKYNPFAIFGAKVDA